MRTRMKWIYLSFIAVSIFFFALSQFYVAIHRGEWTEKEAAIEKAIEQTVLVKASTVEHFVGDETYTIVYGEDMAGKQLIVWMGQDEIHTEYAIDGMSKENAKEQTLINHPNAQMLRVMPGKMKEFGYVWEVFFVKNDKAGDKQYYYAYYKFKDGAILDTYYLGAG